MRPMKIFYKFDLHVIIENVQRRFLSFASYVLKISHTPYGYFTVFSKLKITSLDDRRTAENLSFLNKL